MSQSVAFVRFFYARFSPNDKLAISFVSHSKKSGNKKQQNLNWNLLTLSFTNQGAPTTEEKNLPAMIQKPGESDENKR